jgi:hypothetical protein
MQNTVKSTQSSDNILKHRKARIAITMNEYRFHWLSIYSLSKPIQCRETIATPIKAQAKNVKT